MTHSLPTATLPTKTHTPFEVVSDYAPAGDQPDAIEALTQGIERGDRFQTLLGITGSGKSATMAWTIEQVQRPTLVLAPNKSLAAQLASELQEFFPNNRVEYFVSYYDYYQPEAYIASSDTYIEKDSSINDEIDRLRHSASSALLTRRDTIVVASVSAIYGLGPPEHYAAQLLLVRKGEEYDQRAILGQLIGMRYERNDTALSRGTFRVRGDVIEVHPAYDEAPVRIEMFGDEVESITTVDPVTGERIETLDELVILPATHYVTDADRLTRATETIAAELDEQLKALEGEGKLLEAQRLRMRTEHDLESMKEMGYTNGIENYSRHMDGRSPDEPPSSLLDYFDDDYLVIIDESHVTVPQLHGQYAGDRSRKDTLVEHGFRLPSARDNRPLRFEEILERLNQVVFLSATPGPYELEISNQVVEQVIRPTGLVDPEVEVRPSKGQIDDLLEEIQHRSVLDQRVLITTLTKKMAEDLSEYLLGQGVKVRYLHSEIDTVQRIELIRDLRLGEYDALVGINLLREGLDVPEVSLVAILDADKEGFLRSESAIVQTIGRAARNAEGKVILYADTITNSMQRAMSETNRRRGIQIEHNARHGIEPQTIRKEVNNILAMLRPSTATRSARSAGPVETRASTLGVDPSTLAGSELETLIHALESEMHEASAALKFELASQLRDEIRQLRRELAEVA